MNEQKFWPCEHITLRKGNWRWHEGGTVNNWICCPICVARRPEPAGETKSLQECATELTRKIHSEREEIIKAFIAKYRCQPDEVEQVVQQTEEGSRWFLRKMEKPAGETRKSPHGEDCECPACIPHTVTAPEPPKEEIVEEQNQGCATCGRGPLPCRSHCPSIRGCANWRPVSAPKEETESMVPLGPEDVPPGSALRLPTFRKDCWDMVISAAPDRVLIADMVTSAAPDRIFMAEVEKTYGELQQQGWLIRRRCETEWSRCEKPAKGATT